MIAILAGSICAVAQAGPPYYTNDPGTPGPYNWEINVGYMPFLYSDNTISHAPDIDINFGVGDRIQLTYENAWLRVRNDGAPAKFGFGQSNPGVKWRFYDAGEDKLQISTFPQLFVNNPNDAVQRGIVPPSNTLLLPMEFSKKAGPVNVDVELGYELVRHGPNGWIGGLVVGRELTKRLEVDGEFYSQGNFRDAAEAQPSFDAGGRYRLSEHLILLTMAGRSMEPSRTNQAHFLGYFGMQFLFSSRHGRVTPTE